MKNKNKRYIAYINVSAIEPVKIKNVVKKYSKDLNKIFAPSKVLVVPVGNIKDLYIEALP
jgi:uncharacterized protein YqfB (UPF0267 family)